LKGCVAKLVSYERNELIKKLRGVALVKKKKKSKGRKRRGDEAEDKGHGVMLFIARPPKDINKENRWKKREKGQEFILQRGPNGEKVRVMWKMNDDAFRRVTEQWY